MNESRYINIPDDFEVEPMTYRYIDVEQELLEWELDEEDYKHQQSQLSDGEKMLLLEILGREIDLLIDSKLDCEERIGKLINLYSIVKEL